MSGLRLCEGMVMLVTKEEIALILAKQYLEAESKFYQIVSLQEIAEENSNEEDTLQYVKELVLLKIKMDTVKQTRTLLGLNANQWNDAYITTKIYYGKIIN